jgi:hypothetical protein
MKASGAGARQVLQIPNSRMVVISCGLHLDRNGVTTQNQCRIGMDAAYFGMS